MAEFNELIKNYEKIRDYLREFHVYGYKCRNDFDIKSSRSYDNEKRRIENYLSEYIRYSNSSRGKRLYITADTIDMEENPLFATWHTKTFTKNDIMLHFIILDILNMHDGLTLNEIIDKILNDYLSRFQNVKIPDNMTVRNKLKEYTDVGILYSIRNGKKLQYYINTQGYPQLTHEITDKLLHVCGYYQNILPMGVVGNYIRNRVDSSIIDNPLFSFRHVYLANTLDDEVLLNILKAINEYRTIEFTSGYRKSINNCIKAIPLKILDNVSTGRRYLAAYNIKYARISTFRIDNIKDVKLDEANNEYEYDNYVHCLEILLKKSWGITVFNKKNLDKIEVKLYIDEKYEDYMIKRIKREGKHGILNRVTENTFLYTIEVIDANEMVPWLRTLIGRIISFNCSNKIIEKRFLSDIYAMYEMYKEEENECI
ncbi:WYL domain-containing protein [Vallitalea longa]|uniref:WYL domain-containing protein n=1 Tax=Vallitalea longa TaxID=2936439 RepID=A0A9W5Y7H9_9FIRM|nr:WYL domain-containing protein [Vallitalea longa]GKX28270.1 WYL domain-containing protein [Vallitalea longa]